MIRELAEIDTGKADTAFEEAVRKAKPIFESACGCHGYELHRSTEHAGRYYLIVYWDSVRDHQMFRNTQAFGEWRALVGPYFASPPQVEHIEQVI